VSYVVSPDDTLTLRLGETDPVRQVLQNVAVLLATPKGSVPLYRDFGLDYSCLDKPAPVAEALLRNAVRTAILRWEPRANLIDMELEPDPARPGTFRPRVRIEVLS